MPAGVQAPDPSQRFAGVLAQLFPGKPPRGFGVLVCQEFSQKYGGNGVVADLECLLGLHAGDKVLFNVVVNQKREPNAFNVEKITDEYYAVMLEHVA